MNELTRTTPLEPIEGILDAKMVALLGQSYGINTFGSLADRLANQPEFLRQVLQVQKRIITKMGLVFTQAGLFEDSATTKPRRRKRGVVVEPSDEVVGFDGNLVSRAEYERQLREGNAHETN